MDGPLPVSDCATRPAADDDVCMARALELARQAAAAGEVPVGAVLVHEGAVIAEAANRNIAAGDPTAHAEIEVLRQGARVLGNRRLGGTTLYVTMEPCPMCAGALVHARVERLVYGTPDFRAGATGTVIDVLGSAAVNHRVRVTGGVREDECRALLQQFFRERR